MVGLALALAGAAVTAYLTYEHGKGVVPACAIGRGCEVVAESSYARIGPVPTAAFGLLLYLMLALSQALLLASPPPRVIRGIQAVGIFLAASGAAFSGWLTYVEVAVLRAFCVWCLGSAAILFALVPMTIVDRVVDRPDLVADPEPVHG